MKIIKDATKDFGYLKIFDLYSYEELDVIWKEIFHLDYIMDSVELGDRRAIDKDGDSKMSGKGLFIDDIYFNREFSPILKYNRKLFTDENICNSIGDSHPANKVAYGCINKDSTILNRYSNFQEYLPHYDVATFSAITVLLHKPEKISGGEFKFTDYGVSFGCINNSCIIFPSWVQHSVGKLECLENSRRYSIAQLMYIENK